MNQTDQIARYLRSGKSLTVAQALQRLGVYALSQRVGELRKAGMPIRSEWVRLRSGKRVKRYRWGR